MHRERILVVDDESEIAELIVDYLEAEGFEAAIALDGEEALQRFNEFQPHLVILDIMLPKLDGMEVCRRIREVSSIPILMLSAKRSDTDKILGLGLGADDYVTKPFSPGEMIARVKAQLRRYMKLSPPSDDESCELLKFGDLVIDLKSFTVNISDKTVSFSVKEFEVLKYLALHPSQVFTREQIFDHVWGYQQYGDINTVTVHIRKIREKIEPDPSNPIYIKTVWGVGYKFEGELS